MITSRIKKALEIPQNKLYSKQTDQVLPIILRLTQIIHLSTTVCLTFLWEIMFQDFRVSSI